MQRSKVSFRIQDAVQQLLAYGEPEAAKKLPTLSESEIEKIGELAYRHYLIPKTILNKAICLGTVEFLEGEARPLNRKRRVQSSPKLVS
jgi:hypothetical protein